MCQHRTDAHDVPGWGFILPAALATLWHDRPELRGLYEQNLDCNDLMDMRPLVAQAKALAQWLLSRINPEQPDGKDGSPVGFKAIQALAHVVRIAEQFLRLETQLGPVTRAEMEGVKHGTALTIRKFVPVDRQEAALRFLQEQVGQRHRRFGGES